MSDIPSGANLWFTLAIVGVVVLRFLLRELRVRRMALSRIFVLPGVFALLVLFLIVTTLQHSPDQLVPLVVGSLVAIVVGAGIGLAVAHFTSVKPGPSPGIVLVLGSQITVAIWIAALLLRLVPRLIFGAEFHTEGTVLMLNSVLLVMLFAAILTVRVQIVRRARSEAFGQLA